MKKNNQEGESITIRITGAEIQKRLTNLEKSVSRLGYATYVNLTILLVVLGRIFFF